MKILIIAVIRVGGSYLFHSLANTYNIKKKIYEPNQLPKPNDNTIAKVNIGMFHENEIIEYSKYFEHVIMIDRKNKREQAESASVSKTTKTPDSKYKIVKLDEPLVNYWETKFILASKTIEYISEVLDMEIYYYEDLYFGNKKIKNLIFKPDLSKKLRINKQTTLI